MIVIFGQSFEVDATLPRADSALGTASVTTVSATPDTTTAAVVGEVTNNLAGQAVTARGFCWDKAYDAGA